MKKKILLVDDKETIGKVAGIYLGKDYDFTYIENPLKAIQWLNEGSLAETRYLLVTPKRADATCLMAELRSAP